MSTNRLSVIAIAAFALGLAACDRQESVPAVSAQDQASTSTRQSPSAATPRAVPVGKSDSPATKPTGDGSMEKTCGGSTFRISIEGDAAPAPSTTLSKVGPDGATPIAKPEEMKDYSAVGLACAVARSNGEPYFIVQYGELPFGCYFCEWHYLYDAEGKQLTRSDPPILEDASLPEGKQQFANQKEYEALLAELGLGEPEVEFVRQER
jgi:hypothetical protein